MAAYGGWTGKTLRVDLSSGEIRTEDTIPSTRTTWAARCRLQGPVGRGPGGHQGLRRGQQDHLRGRPAHRHRRALRRAHRITTIFPTVYPDELVATGHMGGTGEPS